MSTEAVREINDNPATELQPQGENVDKLPEDTIEGPKILDEIAEVIIEATNLQEIAEIYVVPDMEMQGEEGENVIQDRVELFEREMVAEEEELAEQEEKERVLLPVNEVIENKLKEIDDDAVRGSIGEIFSEGVLKKISNEITADENVDEITEFIGEILQMAVEAVKETENTTNEIYFWMTYFYLQFCGFQLFMKHVAAMEDADASHEEIAMIVVELVDEIAENSEYLHYNDELPELMAKNLIWKMLNSRPLQRRYLGMTTSQIDAADILDEIIDRMQLEHYAEAEKSLVEDTTSLYEMSAELESVKKEVDVSPTAVCREFAGIFNVAEHFVEGILEESKDLANQNNIAARIEYYMKPVRKVAPFVLPSIESFSLEVGEDTIRRLAATWELTEDWMYCIEFLMGQSDGCSDYFFYDMKWSLPSALYPVPQVTASIYFKIEVSRVKPPVCPINLSFKFESNNLVHNLVNGFPFREMWLFNILDAKKTLFRTLRF